MAATTTPNRTVKGATARVVCSEYTVEVIDLAAAEHVLADFEQRCSSRHRVEVLVQGVWLDRDVAVVPCEDGYEVAGKPLSEYAEIRDYPGHSHSNDMLVGYAVKQTVRGGETQWHGKRIKGRWEHCGHDVAVFAGSGRYGEALDVAYKYRRLDGSYAIVSNLYSCGCRS